MSDQFWLWVGFIGMAAGAAAILAKGGRKTPQEEIDTILHGTVPIIAACSYFAMAVGQGSIARHATVDGGQAYMFYFARYIDWLFTTPLLLTALALTAMHSGVRRPGLLAGLIISDVLMIVTAFFFGISSVAWVKWTWYLISCGAFFAVYYGIWVGLREEANRQHRAVTALFNRSATLLSVLWFLYPLILLVDPEGLGLAGSTVTTALIAVLDLASKVVYGWLSVTEHAKAAGTQTAPWSGLTPQARS